MAEDSVRDDDSAEREDAPRDEAGDGISTAAGSGLAAVIGLAVGGPIGAVAGAMLTAPAIKATRHAWEELAAARRNSAAAMVAVAAHEKSTNPDDLIAEALSTPENAQLLSEAMDAAVHTLDERKVAALAKALANGLSGDTAQVDGERVIIRALAALEAPHIRLLSHIPSHTRRSVAVENQLTTGSVMTLRGLLAVLMQQGLVSSNADEVNQATADERVKKLEDELRKVTTRTAPNALTPVRVVNGVPPRSSPPPRIGWRRTALGDACIRYLDTQNEADQD